MEATHLEHHNLSRFRTGIFISSIAICLGASVVGFFLTNEPVQTWYPFLQKPALNPPSGVFGPVWTVLYLMMGIALYRVRIKPNTIYNKTALILFYVQLGLNVLWSFCFFTLHSPFAGLVMIVLLWLAILFTIIHFFRQSNIAGWLLIPYLAWVSFATYLNFMIWFIN